MKRDSHQAVARRDVHSFNHRNPRHGKQTRRRAIAVAAALFSAAAPAASTFAADYTWTGATDTSWPTSGNWTSGNGGVTFPGAGESATFGTANGSPLTVGLNGDQTVLSLVFNNAANNFIIGPGTPAGALSFDAGGLLTHSATGTNAISARVAATGLTANISGGVFSLTNTAAGAGANAFDSTSNFTVAAGARLNGSVAGSGAFSPGSSSLGSAKLTLNGGTLGVQGVTVAGGLTGQIFVGATHVGSPTAIGPTAAPDFDSLTRINARHFTQTPANLGPSSPFSLSALGGNRLTAGVTSYNGGNGPGAAYPGLDYGNVPLTGPDITGVGNAGAGPDSNTYQSLGYATGTFPAQNNFSARFSGKINIANAGAYIFQTRSDDGSALYIDGQLVVNNNQSQGMINRTGAVDLTVGLHDILVVHFEGTGGSGLVASYTGPDTVASGAASGAQVVIPASVLSATQGRVTMGNSISVSGSSTIDVTDVDVAVFGAMDIAAGATLTRTGNGSARFASTTLNGTGTTSYTVDTGALDVATGTLLGNAGAAATFTKLGSGNLILDSTATAADLGAGSTLAFDVQAGRLVVVRDPAAGQTNNPLGGASVQLNGVGSVLQVRSRSGTNTLDNVITVNQNATIEAGSDNNTAVTLTLGSAANPLTIADGRTLTFDIFQNNTLLFVNSPTATTGGVTKAGPGILRFDQVPTYTGTTTVQFGTLQYNTVFGASPGPVSVGATGLVNFSVSNSFTSLDNFSFTSGSQVTLSATNALAPSAQRGLAVIGSAAVGGQIGTINLNAAGAIADNTPLPVFLGGRAIVNNATAVHTSDTLNLYPGAILELNAAVAGAGVINRAPGNVVELRSNTNLGAQLPPSAIGAFSVARLRGDVADDIALNLGTLGTNAVVELFGGNRRLANANFTFGPNHVYVTQDNAARTWNDGAGALSIGTGGLTIASSNGQTFQINENFTTGSNALTFGTLLPLNGLRKDTGTVYLTQATAHNFAGGAVSVVGGATLRGQATTNAGFLGAFGAGSVANLMNPVVHNGVIRVDTGSTSANSGLTIGTVTAAGQTNLSVGRAAAGFNTTLSLNGPIVRSARGAVALFSSNNVLGSAATGSERVVFANVSDAPARLTTGASPTTINMVAPWFTNISGTTTTSFVDYDPSGATGFTNVAYTPFTGGSLGAATDTTIADVTTAAVTQNTDVTVAALRTNQAISGTGVLNIGTGGLIIQGATGRTIANPVNFGAAEGVLHSNGAINTMSGVVSGTGGITKTGVSTLTVSNAANDFTGPITIDQASLTFASVGSMGAAANPIVINGGIFRPAFSGTIAAGTHPITVNPGGGEFSPDGAAAAVTVNTVIDGAGMLIKNSVNPNVNAEYANALVLGAANTYSGGTIIRRGRVQISSDANLGATGSPLSIDYAQLGVTGTFSTPRTVILSSLNGIANATFQVSSIDVASNQLLDLAGPVIGAGNLQKAGGGTLILSAVGGNGYTGTTAVTAGTLLVNNGGLTGTGGGAVTVSAGATIGGTGSLAGPLTLTGASNLAPGSNNPGTLEVARDLTLSATGATLIELAGATPGDGAGNYDQVHVLRAATVAGTLQVDLLSGFTPSGSDVFYILSRETGSGAFANAPEGAVVNLGGAFAQVTYLANWTGDQGASTLTGGNDVALYNVVPIPEPATAGLIGLAAAGLLARRRRQRA